MISHPLKQIIEAADRAITAEENVDGGWLCVVDNSYGTDLLQESQTI